MVQWLGLWTFTAKSPGSIPGGELRPQKPHGVAKKKKKTHDLYYYVIFNIISEIMCIAFYKTLSMRN